LPPQESNVNWVLNYAGLDVNNPMMI